MKKRALSAAALATFISTAALGCGAQVAEVSGPASTTGGSTSLPVGSETYTDGTYTGEAVSTRHGDVQVQVVIENGALADVTFLAFPSGHGSDRINAHATPILIQEAIETQSADVDVVSGATMTCEAFMQSLSSALEQAH